MENLKGMIIGAIIFLLIIYFLPTIIVLISNKKRSKIGVILLNLLLGWTFLGWIIALILSLTGESKTIIYINNKQKGKEEYKKSINKIEDEEYKKMFGE